MGHTGTVLLKSKLAPCTKNSKYTYPPLHVDIHPGMCNYSSLMFPRKLSIRVIVPFLSKIIKCTTKFENNEMPSRSQKNKEKCLHVVKQAQESQ